MHDNVKQWLLIIMHRSVMYIYIFHTKGNEQKPFQSVQYYAHCDTMLNTQIKSSLNKVIKVILGIMFMDHNPFYCQICMHCFIFPMFFVSRTTRKGSTQRWRPHGLYIWNPKIYFGQDFHSSNQTHQLHRKFSFVQLLRD